MISRAPLLWGIRERVMASTIKAPPERARHSRRQKRESDSRDLPHPPLEFSDGRVAEQEVVTREESAEAAEDENALVEVQPRPVAAKSEAKEPAERTDDPVRMYLREMSSVELLSREGEIAIAKRIEAGREAMIAGLCESPLTFQAIIIWRDELNEGKVFLRDIIDLEATYAGPDAKQAAPAVPGDPSAAGAGAPAGNGVAQPLQAVSPPSAPPAATPFKPAAAVGGEEGGEEAQIPESDLDDDDLENSHVARRDRGRAQAESAGDLRHHRRNVQAATPPAGSGHPVSAQTAIALSGAAAQV